MMKYLAHPLVVILITLCFLLFWWSLFRTIFSFKTSQTHLESLRSEVQESTKKVQKLEVELQEARTPFAKEKIARNELLQQKPGEYLVKIEYKSPQTTSKLVNHPATPWEEWKKLLFE